MALVRRVQHRKRIVLRDIYGNPLFKIRHKKKRTESGTQWEMIAQRVDLKPKEAVT